MVNDGEKKRRHTLADHLYGSDHDHVHGDGSADHDHDHDLGPAGPLEENPLWLHDNLSLVSVGIDIGSAGTQVIFSRLHMRRLGEDLSSRYFVVARDALYQSPVTFTPYVDDVRIDERALGRIIDDAYQAAGLHPDEIDTGSVILTGEALRRENAQAIAELLAEMGGEFVCAAAGHHMEAMLAAYGSGAAKVSHDQDLRVLNVDICGGTTKLAVIEGGRVLETAAGAIGGRLVGGSGVTTVHAPRPARHPLARPRGLPWGPGKQVSDAGLDALGDWMAGTLCSAILESTQGSYLTEPLKDLSGIEGVMFSGGVGEYVYGRA